MLESSMTTTRVHIVGCRRSGTTLMMELLWYGFRFSGRDEHEVSVFEPIPSGHNLYLTKKPPDTLRIHRIFEADPDLHVIAMLRDPRAVITSTHPNRPNVYFSSYWRWQEYLRAVEPLLGHPRFQLVHYEQLVKDPARVQRDLERRFQFLQRTRAFIDFPEGANVPPGLAIDSLNGVRDLDVSRITGWQEHLPRINSQLRDNPRMAQDLIDAGYEKDDAWTRMLQGIDHYSQTYKDEPPGKLRTIETNVRFWRKTRSYLRSLRSRTKAAHE